MYRSIVIALLLLVGGCAGMAGVAAPETAKGVEKARTVGVISASDIASAVAAGKL